MVATRKQKTYLCFMALILIAVVGGAVIHYSQEVAKNTEIARTSIHLHGLEMQATSAALTAASP